MSPLKNQNFVDQLEDKYGRYEKTTVLLAVDSYLTKFIRPEKLNDVLCFIDWFYAGKESPPSAGEIEKVINIAISKQKGDDPFKHPDQPGKYEPGKKENKNYEKVALFFNDLRLRYELSIKHNLKHLLPSKINYNRFDNMELPNYDGIDFNRLEKSKKVRLK